MESKKYTLALCCDGIQKTGARYQISFEWGSLWLDEPLCIGQRYEITVRPIGAPHDKQ